MHIIFLNNLSGKVFISINYMKSKDQYEESVTGAFLLCLSSNHFKVPVPKEL